MEARPVPLAPPPGVVKTETDRVIEGRWSDSQWMRFVNARPQKRGGFTKQNDANNMTSGIPRAMHAWRDLSASEFLAAGTRRKLYVYDSTFTRHDITPLSSSGTLGSNPFTTTSGSSIVTVAHTSHGRNSGDTAILSGSTAVGGVTPNGEFIAITTLANSYTIDVGSNASSSTSGGGSSVAYKYEVASGTELGTYGLGFGSGAYGTGTFGTARTASTLIVDPRVWSLNNYGALLLAAFNGGSIYEFDPADLAINGRATALDNAPTDVRFMFITEERFVFALREDMVVSWPDQDDFTDWTPTDANTANTRRLTDGTKLIGGLSLVQGLSLVWSDNALYLFQYLGADPVYSSRKIASACGLIGPNAACVDSIGVAYWMSAHDFHYYNGGVDILPNSTDIRAFVYDQLRTDQPYLCWAYYDAKFDEVNFFYVPVGSDDPEFSVTYHKKDQCWTPTDWSAFPRASAGRFQHGDTRPYLGGADSNIYLHETGFDADNVAIEASLTYAPGAIGDGAENYEIDGVRMDLKDQSGNVTVTFTTWDQLIDTGILETVAKAIPPTEKLTDLRIAGRYIGFTIVSDSVGGYFRWGKPIALVLDGDARR